MTILKIAALSSLIVAAGLAGCSLSNYDRGRSRTKRAELACSQPRLLDSARFVGGKEMLELRSRQLGPIEHPYRTSARIGVVFSGVRNDALAP